MVGLSEDPQFVTAMRLVLATQYDYPHGPFTKINIFPRGVCQVNKQRQKKDEARLQTVLRSNPYH
jgi:hypothetical protein